MSTHDCLYLPQPVRISPIFSIDFLGSLVHEWNLSTNGILHIYTADAPVQWYKLFIRSIKRGISYTPHFMQHRVRVSGITRVSPIQMDLSYNDILHNTRLRKGLKFDYISLAVYSVTFLNAWGMKEFVCLFCLWQIPLHWSLLFKYKRQRLDIEPKYSANGTLSNDYKVTRWLLPWPFTIIP